MFITAEKARAWGGKVKRCRCSERQRGKAGGCRSLAHTRWSVGRNCQEAVAKILKETRPVLVSCRSRHVIGEEHKRCCQWRWRRFGCFVGGGRIRCGSGLLVTVVLKSFRKVSGNLNYEFISFFLGNKYLLGRLHSLGVWPTLSLLKWL